MIKVGVIGIAAVLLATQMKMLRADFSVYIILAAGIMAGLYTVDTLSEVVGMVRSFWDQLPVEAGYVNRLIKMIGITYLAQLAAGLCKDAGYAGLAGQIETFGKLTILSLSFPVMLALLETVKTFLYEGI